MPYKTCRHIMEHGQFCQSPALSKRDYCYFHIEFRARRLKMARARAICEQWWLDLPCIEDMRSCQAATSRVIEGMAAKVIDPERGKALLSGLRLSASNFKARKAWGPLSDYRVNQALPFVGTYPGFEAVHNLPADLDLDEDPLTAFPIPESPEPLPLAETEAPNVNSGTAADVPLAPLVGSSWSKTIWGGEASAEDMELMDIAKREGQDAMLRRAAQVERNRRRSERRLQRARYAELARKHNIQLAAEKIVAEQKRAAAAKAQANIAENEATAEARAGATPALEPRIGDGPHRMEELTDARKPPSSAGSVTAAPETAAASVSRVK